MRNFRWTMRRRRKLSKIKIAVVAVAALFCGMFIYFEAVISPFMVDFTVLKGEQLMSEFFSRAVSDELEELGFSYESLIETNYSDSGDIQSVNTNVVNVNILKNAVTLDISQQLGEYYEFDVDFPLTNAMGSEFLSGMGPTVNFNSYVTGSVKTDFRSEFETGGLNQTVHRLYIDITGDLVVLAGGSQEPIELTTSVLVGETVIIGAVPSLYTGL